MVVISFVLLQTVLRSPGNIKSDLDKPFKLQLASGDKTGNIILWNVLEASIATTLTEPTLKSVLDMKWVVRNDYFYLLVLYSPSALVLWNVQTSSKIWRIEFNDSLSWFELNPFDASHLILASNSGLIYFINDFALDKKPVQVELKYTISSNRSTSKSTNNSDFQQVVFSPAARNVCYFLLSREIIIFDLTIHQAIGSLVLDRSRGSFTNLLTCIQEPNLFICVHEDASLSAWLRKKSEFKFELECYSDIIRFNKHSKKKGLSITCILNSPLHENQIASVTNDGSIWIWDYSLKCNSIAKEHSFRVTALIEHISSSISSLCVSPFTTENESLIALGSYHGTIQIVDMVKSVTSYEFLLWNQPVRGVRWASPNSLMAFNCEE
jgi:WD40 repeat protein